MINNSLKQFLFPTIKRLFIIRLILVATAAFLIFTYVLIPFKISGQSMEPTYLDGTFNFCFRLRYFFSEPQQGDIVAIRMAGESVMLLKRIVGLPGDVVEFKSGRLFINNKPLQEPYLVYPSDWNLPPRRVKPGYLYVVGDNRNVPIQTHRFGQTSVKRIVGSPLW